MIVFWFLYILISTLIAFLSINLFKNIFLKSLAFSLILAVLTTVWFKSPGEIVFAPVLSIFLLESSIFENNGLSRILRPIGVLTIFYFAISYTILKRNSKN
tara:strand:+ start:21022 stop:21324 length:303 start_codon:yes stop_codon:yes gene_type:complete